MNTPAINSPLAALTPAANNKQDAAASSEAGAFNQVLTREIAGRNDTSNNAGNMNNDVNKNKQKDASAKDDKSANGTTDNKANSNETSDTAEVAKSADDSKAATLADAKDADAIAAGPSAELLAFVAALTQANTAVAQNPVTDAAVETAASAKITDIDAKLDTTLGVGTTATASSDKDAIGKKSDFVAALDKATTATGDGSKTPAAATPSAKPEVDLAASVAVPKTAEAVSNPQNIAAVSTAALQQLSETSAVQSNKLAPQVGSPDWNQALGQKVVWMVQGAQQTATLTLNPPDLGPMQVTLNVSNNQATANFTAHQPEVRHALEAAMPRLREMLNDAGIQLGQSNVSAGTQNQQNAFSEQRQGGRQSGQNSNSTEPVVHVSHVPVPSAGNGIVDTFA